MTRTLTGLLPLLVLSGCVGSLCRGAGCEAVWPAGQVLIMNPFDAEVARTATSAAHFDGTADDGAGWTAAVLGDFVFIGKPEINEVVRWDPVVEGNTPSAVPDWRGPQPELGAQVVAVDVFGSNIRSLWLGAPGASLDAGAVVVFSDTRQDGNRTWQAAALLFGESPGDRLGATAVDCPDLTGDGGRDLLVAAPRASTGEGAHAGAVFLVPSDQLVPGNVAFEGPTAYDQWSVSALRWHVAQSGAALGRALACNADLTGDGVADVVIGAPGHGDGREGAVWVLDGSALPASGLLPEPTLVGSAAGAWLGSAVATGDLDGDNIGDLAVGAAGAATGQGEVSVHYGPKLSPARTVLEPIASGEPMHLGRSLLLADLDADGFDELILGAEDAVDGEDFDAGQVGVWRGSATRLDPNLTFGEDEDWRLEPDHAYQRLGGELVAHELGLVLAVRSRGF